MEASLTPLRLIPGRLRDRGPSLWVQVPRLLPHSPSAKVGRRLHHTSPDVHFRALTRTNLSQNERLPSRRALGERIPTEPVPCPCLSCRSRCTRSCRTGPSWCRCDSYRGEMVKFHGPCFTSHGTAPPRKKRTETKLYTVTTHVMKRAPTKLSCT